MSERRIIKFLGIVLALAMLLSACSLPGKAKPVPAANPPLVTETDTRAETADKTADTEASEEAAEVTGEDGSETAGEPAEETTSVEAVPSVEASVAQIKDSGNIILAIGPDAMRGLGYEPADVILVKIGTAELEMPIGTNYSDVDTGEPVCLFKTSSSGVDQVVLAVNIGNMASLMGIAGEPIDSLTVSVSMAEKQGYAAGYAIHQLGAQRSKDRADYPDLSDAEYANFRAVETTGFGMGTLYRSSSPVDPALNRNREADAAMQLALVRTVINLANSEETMKGFADYNLTYYSQCSVLALNMGMDFFTADKKLQNQLFENDNVEAHTGTKILGYVIEDGKLTGVRFSEGGEEYGIGPDSPQYAEVSAGNIEASLSKAFGVGSIRDENADLQACAESYLERIGMARDEITLLKEKLAEDYAGLNAAA